MKSIILSLVICVIGLVYVSQTQTLSNVSQVGCASANLSGVVLNSSGLTTRQSLSCVTLDPNFFELNGGVLTIKAPPSSISFVYDAPLMGVINGTNPTFTIPSAPSVPASLTVFNNGIKNLVGQDFSLSGMTITFITTSIPKTGDLLTATYQK